MTARVRYVIVDEDGDLIALDQASGGYPYKAHSLTSVEYWQQYEKADSYRNTMRKRDQWEIMEAELVLRKVE